MFESVSKKIGDHTYAVTKLDAKRGIKAGLRLAKVAAPAIAAYRDDESGAEKAIGALLSSIDEKDFDYLTELFASTSTVSGGKYGTKTPTVEDVYSLHFVDRYNELLGWMAFAVKVNFSSFFDGLPALLAGLGSESQSQP